MVLLASKPDVLQFAAQHLAFCSEQVVMSQSSIRLPSAQPVFKGMETHGNAAHSASEPVDIVDLNDLIAILGRRKTVFFGTAMLVILLGVAFLLTTPPTYTSSTSIFVDPRNKASFQIEMQANGAFYDPGLVETQTLLIVSDTILQRVIASERLMEDEEFNMPDEGMPEILKRLKNAIKVKRAEKSYIVDMEVSTKSAEKSARLANALAQAYLADNMDAKTESARRESGWLSTTLETLEARLRQAEDRVEAFKVTNGLVVDATGKVLEEQRITEFSRSMVETQRKTSEAKANLEQIEQILKSGHLPDSSNDALRSPAIERLRSQMSEISRLEANSRTTLGPRHPAAMEINEQLVQMRRLLNEELKRVAEGARQSYIVAKNNEEALERRLASLKRGTGLTNQTLVELRELERAAESQKAVFLKFLADKEQIARLTLSSPAGRIVTPATVSPKPASPKPKLVMSLTLVLALFMATFMALVVETLSRPQTRRSRLVHVPQGHEVATTALVKQGHLTEEKPAAQTGVNRVQQNSDAGKITCLAHLPRMTHARSGGFKNRPDLNDAYSLAVNQLCTSLLETIGSLRPVTLLVIGLRNGAGASTFATSLAWSFAAARKTTLLIDANPGRGSVSSMIETEDMPVAIRLFGRRKSVLVLRDASAAGPFFLPYGTLESEKEAHSTASPMSSDILVVDGPPLSSPALDRVGAQKNIDGVMVVMNSHDEMNAALEATLIEQFGKTLIGYVKSTS